MVAPILLALEGEMSTERGSKMSRRLSSGGKKKSKDTAGIKLERLQHANRFAPLLVGTACVFVIATLYTILFRGCGWVVSAGGITSSNENVFNTVYGTNKGSTDLDDVASLVQKNLIHSQVMVTAARLAGTGFWTATSIFGPLLHLGGVLSTFPSLYLLASHMWSGQKMPMAKAILTLPLNLIPLILCRGIPTLGAAALLGGIGGTVQLLATRRKDWELKMQI